VWVLAVKSEIDMKSKSLAFWLLGIVATVAIAAQIAPPIRGDWTAEQVTKNVYVIHGPLGNPSPENQGFMNNPAFVVGPEGVVVIDPGGTVQTGHLLMKHLKATTDKPVVAVIDTHIHGDHWLGNQAVREAYPEVPIYGHPRLVSRVKAGADVEWLSLMHEMTHKASEGTVAIPPEKEIKDGDRLSLAGLTFEVMHVDKSHTDSDLMLYIPELETVFTGDNVGNNRILRIDQGSFKGNMDAIAKLLELPAKTFVPGHGRSGGREVPENYLKYMQTVYKEVEAAFEEGKPDYEVRPTLIPKLSAWKDWDGFGDTVGGHINTSYLEIEAAAF
jgi:glyoxylase-like metal-dependent hydrolase (beta-lactamase superfamily II)